MATGIRAPARQGGDVRVPPAPYPTSNRLARRQPTRVCGNPIINRRGTASVRHFTRHYVAAHCGTTDKSPTEAGTLAAAREVVQPFHEAISWSRLMADSVVQGPAPTRETHTFARTEATPLPRSPGSIFIIGTGPRHRYRDSKRIRSHHALPTRYKADTLQGPCQAPDAVQSTARRLRVAPSRRGGGACLPCPGPLTGGDADRYHRSITPTGSAADTTRRKLPSHQE